MSSTIIKASNKFGEITIDLQGGTLLSWVNNGQEVFYQGLSPKRSGVPILFPFANPLKNGIFEKSGLPIGQHGFARNSLWQQFPKNLYEEQKNYFNIHEGTLDEVWNNYIHIVLSSNYIPQEMQTAYPYQFTAEILVDISRPNKLIYSLVVNNNDDVGLPIAPGIHPYFPIQHESKKDFKIVKENVASQDIVTDSSNPVQKYTELVGKLESNNLIFSGQNINWNQSSTGFFNDFEKSATLIFPDKKIVITEQSENLEIQNLVVWSQVASEPDCNFICVEPFTRNTNAINENPILVKPKQTWSMAFEFEII